MAKAFISLGLEPHHTVAFLGHHSPALHISTHAAIQAGGFATGIYQTNSPSACQYVAHDSRANILVVGNTLQLEKILSIKESLPHLRAIVLYEGSSNDPSVISWSELLKIGSDNDDSSLDQRLRSIGVNQCSVPVYTSGTTGNPKGTMLSHDTMTYTANYNTNLFNWQYGKESVLSYLPQSHIAGMMMDMFMIMAKGGVCYFADKNALKGTLIENFKEYQPTRVMGVTRVFEKVEEAMKKQSVNSPLLKRKLGEWAKSQALNHYRMGMKGQSHWSLGYKLAQKIVFSKVHSALGFNNTVPNGFIIGGAAVSPGTVEYFLSLDIKLCELISMSEAAGCAQIANLDSDMKLFRVGRVGLPYQDGMEIKLNDVKEDGSGEMLSRGRGMLMGYMNNKEKSMEAIDDDGWFHSRDIVKPDEEGFYSVVGRIKEIIITAGGENVAPTNIEDEIRKQLPLVSNVMVVGDKQKYLTCLITLKVTMKTKSN